MSKAHALRALVTERLTAAAEEIFVLFEKTFAEYEEELCRSREEHNHRRVQHPWEHPYELRRIENTQTWTHPGAAAVSLECIKKEPQDQLSVSCVKTEDSSLLQCRQTEDQQETSADGLSSEMAQHSPYPNNDGWEQFSYSETQMETAALNPGVQVKVESVEQLGVGHSSYTDSEEYWEAFTCPANQTDTAALHSGVFSETQPTPEPTTSVLNRNMSELSASVLNGNMSELSGSVLNMSDASDVRKHQCPVCLKAFGSRSHLQRHAIVHTGEKPFSCSVCHKRLNSKSYLIVHMRSHTGERPYRCPFCSKGFSHRSAFNFHVQTHSTDRRFSCSVCSKSFTVEYYLKVHMRTHSGERPHSCSFCPARFTQKSSLNLHLRTHQSADQGSLLNTPWTCT